MSVETITDSDTSRDLESSRKSCREIRISAALSSHAPEMQFYPAGSLVSHKDSILSSDEDSSQPMPRKAHSRVPSVNSAYFQPTPDNVIIFEVAPTDDKEWRDEDAGQLGQVKHWLKAEKRETGVDLEGKNVSIAHLQQVISQQKLLIQGLKQQPERHNQSTMTLSCESQQELEREIEHLTSSCKRYERQNQELRTELQSCTSDLLQLDQTKSKLLRELRKTQSKAENLEANLRKLAIFVDSVLSKSEEQDIVPSVPKIEAGELVEYLCCRVEVMGAKYSRLLAGYAEAVERYEALKQQVEGGYHVKQAQLDTLQVKSTRNRLKDRFIKQLESTISAYKEKLLALPDQDETGEDDTPAMAQTENLNKKLKQIREEVQSFRSQQGSPERHSPAISPCRSPELEAKYRGMTRLEESQRLDTRQSRPSDEVDISEGQVLKPENSVQTKQALWTAKQGQKSFKGPSLQLQKPIKERFRPVLLGREAAKEPAFRIGKLDEDRGKGSFAQVQTTQLPDTLRSKRSSTAAIPKNMGVKSTSMEPRKVSYEGEQKSKPRTSQARDSK